MMILVLLNPFEDSGGALAAAHAHRDHAVRALRRSISRRMVAVSFAPVHPSGWPSAMAPPFTIDLLRDRGRRARITASACTAKASFSSITSMSSSLRPASASALGIATTGPMPMISGGTPPAAKLTKRAIGFRPSSRALRSDITSAAAAPSLVCEELPAVTVPLA